MLGEYDFSEEKLRDTLDILPPKKHSSERAKTGRKSIVKTAIDQITSTITVADFVPLCRRTLYVSLNVKFWPPSPLYPCCMGFYLSSAALLEDAMGKRIISPNGSKVPNPP